MPEFVLSGRDLPAFLDLPDIVQGYVEAAFFTANRESEGGDIPDDAGFESLAPETLAAMRAACSALVSACEMEIEVLLHFGYEEDQIGRDFYFTRAGHGTGFWDRKSVNDLVTIALSRLDRYCDSLPTHDLYLGDDGLIYVYGDALARVGG